MTSIESPVTEVNHNDRDSHFRIGPALTVAAAIGALGARFFLVISKYSVNVFFFDQWDFNNATLFERHTLWEMFRWQHGPHRQGLGALLTWLFEPLFSWNSRAGPFFIGACLFAAMLFALRLKCKLYGPLSHSDVAIPTIFLTLAQFEVMFNAPNPAYSGLPMLMIMLYCLALLRRSRLPSYALVLSLNFLLIYTGYGLLMGAITLGVFLLECYWSWRHMTSVPFAQALAGFGVAAASLASFFVHYQPVTAADCFEIPHRHLLQYPRFMALMFSAFVVPRPFLLSSGVTLLGGATILIVLGAVFCLHLLHLLKSPRPASHLIGAILVSFSLLFAAGAAVGRLCLGLNAAFTSRYCTLLIPAFLAIYFYLLSKSWRGMRNLILALWVILLLPAAIFLPRTNIHWFADGKRNWANCYIRTENIRYCDQSTKFVIYPHPEQTGLQQKLDYLKEHRLNLFAEPAPK
jgi:hypothetical protein